MLCIPNDDDCTKTRYAQKQQCQKRAQQFRVRFDAENRSFSSDENDCPYTDSQCIPA
jgi:hypothetical protein